MIGNFGDNSYLATQPNQQRQSTEGDIGLLTCEKAISWKLASKKVKSNKNYIVKQIQKVTEALVRQSRNIRKMETIVSTELLEAARTVLPRETPPPPPVDPNLQNLQTVWQCILLWLIIINKTIVQKNRIKTLHHINNNNIYYFFYHGKPLVAQTLEKKITKLFGSEPYSGRSSSTKPSCSKTEWKRCTVATEIRWNKNEDARTSPVVSTNRQLPNSLKNWGESLLIGLWNCREWNDIT